MNLKKIVEHLELNVLTAYKELDVDVTNGYTSDLLSDVIAKSQEKDIWITLQTHQNIIAVAVLKELSGIIIVNNRKPDEETLKKAEEEKIPLLTTGENAFTISGKIFQLLSEEK